MFEILKQLSIILFTLLGLTSNVGAPIGNATSTTPSLYEQDLAVIQNDVSLNNYVDIYMSNLAIIENSHFVKNKKYLQRLKDKQLPVYSDLPQIEVHEYVSPKGEGYQVYFRMLKNGHLFERSSGVGVEAVSRNFEWR